MVANGIGGYASSTATGINTRRYHGLLVAALKPPVERMVLLSSIQGEMEIDGRTFYLGANEYPDGRIFPDGYVYVDEFRLQNGIPSMTYRLGDCRVTKTAWMEYGHNTTYVRYTYFEGHSDCALVLRPMCNYRDYHGMTQGSLDWNFGVEEMPGGCKIIAKEGAAPFWLTSQGRAEFTHTGVWYWNHVYREEVARGLDETEDLYSPGVLRVTLRPGDSFTLVASTEPPEATEPLVNGALEREQDRQDAILVRAGVPLEAANEEADNPLADPLAMVAELVRAADSFLVERDVDSGGDKAKVPTVIAGYHWFTDWGRDTMISLPGLCIPTGREEDIARTLRTFASFAHEGLIPNNFPDSGDPPAYNTADATLWLFATTGLLAQAGDNEIGAELYPTLADIISWHAKGTLFGIGVDPEDGLLHAGEEGYQLTWMDAKVDGWVVTPRMGKPVEINALWIHALDVMDRLSKQKGVQVLRGADTPDFKALAGQARASFKRRFWYEKGGYLYDVIDGPNGDDPSLRPNQLLALSLVPGLVTEDQARSVLRVVRAKLLTPYGLRTLSPDDPEYKGQCTGDRVARDGAYHQGTVWTWLLGPYFDAVRAAEGEVSAQADLTRMLPALRTHLGTAGLGSISEIFDGDVPHMPRGCISQAWSVAEVLRQVWGPRNLLGTKA